MERTLAAIEAAAGALWRPDFPVLSEAELQQEIARAWARAAAERDDNARVP